MELCVLGATPANNFMETMDPLNAAALSRGLYIDPEGIMRRLLLALLCTAACGISAALAADLPARPVYKAPQMAAPSLTWTGFTLV
jgi:hypothetical protein